MFGVLFALENVVLMTQELVLCAAGLVYKKKGERESARGNGAPVTPRVFIQGCLSHPCLSKSRKIKKKTSTKGQGRNLKSEMKPSRTRLKASFLPHLADCCSGRLSHNGGPRGAVSGTYSSLKRRWRRRKLVPIPPLFL